MLHLENIKNNRILYYHMDYKERYTAMFKPDRKKLQMDLL